MIKQSDSYEVNPGNIEYNVINIFQVYFPRLIWN